MNYKNKLKDNEKISKDNKFYQCSMFFFKIFQNSLIKIIVIKSY